jgi:alkylation response protein AidB-like acyl-CoA dehydrogenase
VRGRWSFVSGCEHADVLFGNGMTSGDSGEPPLRITVFRPRDVVIEDTWDVSGLRGTGSHHIRVDELVVPAERTLDPLSGAPCIDAVITHIHPPPLLACAVASIALGIARGALDDALSLAEGKVPMLDHAPVATNPTFHVELASADAAVRAAHALVHDAIATLWATAGAGDEPTLVDRARMRAAAVWATERAVAAVDSAYRSGGGDAVFASSPLQRRLRDVHAVTQHFLVRPDTMATAGAILAGNDVDVLVF